MELKIKLLLIIFTIIQINTKEPINFDITHNITKDSFTRDLAIYFAVLSSYGYCSVENMTSGNCCNEWINDENWKLEAAIKLDYDNYHMAILKNDKTKKIVFTFPGTRGIYQFVQEVMNSNGIGLQDDPAEKIMFYFNNIYASSQSKIQNVISDITKFYTDYQYIFTGHSLGGSVATVIAFHSIKNGIIKSSENNPVLITYGQPRTGNSIFANELMKYIPVVFRVVRLGDLVPHIPLCETNFLSSECYNILPDSKFDKNLNLTEAQIKIEIEHFYPWHLGGLKMFNYNMTEFADCGDEFGENHPNLLCKDTMSVDLYNHVYYFDRRVSSYCSGTE